ncbi:MAG: hypothetical protein M1819_005637 [Sarea resinae]|nr:MAG: hypothetical protein M1819_005637 [Sarea resinae]
MASLSAIRHDTIPGTVHLVDLEGTMHAKHASGQQHDVVLVPSPSSSPEDPLNWSPRRKLLSTVCMCVYTLMVGIASAAIYSILEPISLATGLSLGDLNDGTGYMFLFFGWGCLVWQPLALQYGKRPVYLISILATMAIMIWAPYTRSNGQWIANKILQGFFGAPIESLCEISVTDIYFTHERGGYMALYGLFLVGSNYLAPILAGFINDGQGWKWVLYWCAIFCAIGFVFLFFFLEETNFDRHNIADEPEPESDPDSVSDTINSTADKDQDQNHEVNATPALSEKGEKAPIPSSRDPSDVEFGTTTLSSPAHQTFLQKMALIKPSALHKSPRILLQMMVHPLVFLTLPVISYAGFSYGSNLIWFNVLNGTASLILGSPPYNFSSAMVGLSYVSALIGVAVAVLYTGPFGNRFILYLARRNGGIMEPEHRLWLFTPSLLLIPGGLILWGVGAAHGIAWPGVVIGMGIIAATNTIGLQLSISYALDSYKDLSGEVMITVILIRNTMSFAVGYGITPWVKNMGLQNAFLTAAGAGLAQCMTVWLMIKWGRKLRAGTGRRYWGYVEDVRRKGLAHPVS